MAAGGVSYMFLFGGSILWGMVCLTSSYPSSCSPLVFGNIRIQCLKKKLTPPTQKLKFPTQYQHVK